MLLHGNVYKTSNRISEINLYLASMFLTAILYKSENFHEYTL